jgi:hypothetical protein
MFLMYVDESGDCGLVNSPSRYFVLTGLVVHELRWQPYFNQMVDFRRRMKLLHGLKLREEIHAGELLRKPGPLARIPPNDRLGIIRALADELATMADLNIINIVVDKQNKTQGYDVFENAWQALIQRFENTLSHRNFRGPINTDDRGLLFADHTDDKKLTKLMRKMRVYNPIPSMAGFSTSYRMLPLVQIIEDPNFRNSADSLYIQAVDTATFLLYQSLAPSRKIKRAGAQNYFRRLDPILCKKAARNNPQGIVFL